MFMTAGSAGSCDILCIPSSLPVARVLVVEVVAGRVLLLITSMLLIKVLL